ncbi:Dur3 protein [Saccharomycopsis crataegensis]|uniref:Dur3 protein n=1 Tax=Saccharomycopsis crataegensis TaxID=43959 RepID=A0AAV5QXM6_9ASCO|nr:Dur3 protein [Saccharomycopsis crataegensis]
MSDVKYALNQGAGYGVVVGVGLAFSVGMILTTLALKRYQKQIVTAEEFVSAGRSVRTSLVGAAVVSSWCWAATLLQSTTQVYKNGVSGAFYYASGACVQIILFAFLAIKAKQLAPEAHTYLEIIKTRYGKAAHGVYMFFALATNILVTAMLLTGGSATISDLTGMNTVAAIFLLPLGVTVYTLFGGIKATFLTDYAHTVMIVVIIMTFAFNVFSVSDKLGSPSAVWELVTKRALETPVSGNAEGSYLTMKSRSGGIFFVINIVGNFGTVFLDNGYWLKGFASSPAAALPGYVLGGLAWFALPWFTATTMGLAALALEDTPSFPTYPNRMTDAQVSSGLVLPNAAVALMGKGGAGASLILVFMAVTSAFSAELMAVSSIFTYDIYREYVNPNASGKKLIFISHLSVILFSLVMAGFSTGIYYGNVSMGYLYEFMGVAISAAVGPCAATIMSSKQNKAAAIWSPILGTICSICSWLGSTKALEGSVTYLNTFADYPMLIGNVVALLSPIIFIPVLTYAFGPQNFDWNILKSIKRADETEEILEATAGVHASDDIEKKGEQTDIAPVSSYAVELAKAEAQKEELLAAESENLRIASKKAGYICLFLTWALLIMWPMPMYGTGYIFSEKFFTGWIVVGFIWIFFTGFVVVVYPLVEGREDIWFTMKGIYWDCTGQSYKLKAYQESHPEELHVVKSQISAKIHEQPSNEAPEK